MRKQPEVIGLDIDNTLYEYAPCDNAAMKKVSDSIIGRFNIDSAEWKRAFESSRKDLKRRLGDTASSHSRLLYFKGALDSLNLASHSTEALHLERVYWGEFMRSMQKRQGVDAFLKTARENNIPVYLLTDLTAETQLRKLHYLNIVDLVSGIFTSEEAGKDKPSPQFHNLIQDKLGNIDSHWWIIGDSESKDGELASKFPSADFLCVKGKNRDNFFVATSKSLKRKNN